MATTAELKLHTTKNVQILIDRVKEIPDAISSCIEALRNENEAQQTAEESVFQFLGRSIAVNEGRQKKHKLFANIGRVAIALRALAMVSSSMYFLKLPAQMRSQRDLEQTTASQLASTDRKNDLLAVLQ